MKISRKNLKREVINRTLWWCLKCSTSYEHQPATCTKCGNEEIKEFEDTLYKEKFSTDQIKIKATPKNVLLDKEEK